MTEMLILESCKWIKGPDRLNRVFPVGCLKFYNEDFVDYFNQG